MQFPYVKQVHDKAKTVRELLARFVPKDMDAAEVLLPVTASPAELGYRTSTKLCLHEDEFGRRAIGLYERGTKKVVAIPECPVHHQAINQMVQRLFPQRGPLPAPFYNHAKRGFQPGRLKFVTLRYCPETQAFGIVLSHTGVDDEALGRWAISHAAPNVSIFQSSLDRDDEDLVLGSSTSHLAGPPDVPFVVGPMTYRLSPLAFFQANFALTERFVDHITAGIGGDTLLDLYGGFGAYGLAAAPRFKKVLLVDANPHAISAAKKTIKALGLGHAETAPDSVETFLERRLNADERRHVSHIIVNPPRGGLSSKTRDLLTGPRMQSATSLTYVSCNIETLKRDLAQLTAGGFRVQSVQPFDMFPQTDHLELVVKMVRRSKAPANGDSKRPRKTQGPNRSKDRMPRHAQPGSSKSRPRPTKR